MIRGHTTLSPSGPNTNDEPTNAKSSSRLMRPPSVWNTRWPTRGLQHQQREDDLQRQPPGDRPAIDRAAVGGHRVGERHDHDQPDQRLQPRQAAEVTAAAQTAASPSAPSSTTPSRLSNGARRLGLAAPPGSATVIAASPEIRATTIGASAAGASETSMARRQQRQRLVETAAARDGERAGPVSPAATWSPTAAPPPRCRPPGRSTSSSRLRPAPSATAARPTSSALQRRDVPGACGGHVGAIGRRGSGA